jgi:hypothetical protein
MIVLELGRNGPIDFGADRRRRDGQKLGRPNRIDIRRIEAYTEKTAAKGILPALLDAEWGNT